MQVADTELCELSGVIDTFPLKPRACIIPIKDENLNFIQNLCFKLVTAGQY